jgi:hypothetical protein
MEGSSEHPVSVTPPPSAPVVHFPEPVLAAEVAALEAAQTQLPATFSWPVAIAWSLGLALVGSALFAGVAYATEAQFGIVSIVIGVLAGIGAARGGHSRRAQIVGAASAAIGYFAGQIMVVAVMVGSRFFELPTEAYVDMLGLLVEQTFTSMDALFLGIAVYEGWMIPRVRT